MKTWITGGRVIDPRSHIDSKLNVVLEGGKVVALTTDAPDFGARIIRAENRVVCPGFLDIHMHEAPVADLSDIEGSILGNMLRMGVTTALGGNCGENVLPPKDYFQRVEGRLPIYLALLAGHGAAREAAGYTNRYQSLAPEQVHRVADILNTWLEDGCFGISYGIRYYPGTTREELLETAQLCQKEHLLVAAHVRDDADYIFDSITEFLEPGWKYGLKMQVSHLGSMGGYGQMAQVLSMLDAARAGGLDVMSDCYPYDAFSTRIGETTYDPGFLERYHCDYSAIGLCGGTYDGQRCTKEIFDELRKEHPETITVGYVMQPEDVRMAMAHPAVMLCSDGLMEAHEGHPRAAGTFPRLIAQYVRTGTLRLYDAIEKMTSMPAQRIGLSQKGSLAPGCDADVVIFDPDTIEDRATFQQPDLPPVGIDYVLMAGEIACDHGTIVNGTLGAPILRK